MDSSVLTCLCTLSEHGASLEHQADADAGELAEGLIGAAQVEAARRLCTTTQQEQDPAQAWQAATEAGVSFLCVAKAIASQLRSPTPSAAAHAAGLYSALLSARHGPVSALFNPLIFSSFLQVLKSTASGALSTRKAGVAEATQATQKPSQPRGRKRAQQQVDSDVEDEDDDGADSDGAEQPIQKQSKRPAAATGQQPEGECQAILSDLVTFLGEWGMANQQEMLHMLLDACAEILVVSPATVKSGRAGSSRATGGAAELVYKMLTSLMSTRHGPISNTGALVMMRLLPILLGTSTSASTATAGAANKKGGAQEAAARRTAALQHVLTVYRQFPGDMQPALCALVRQLCLRVQDKAELRAAATGAATELVAAMPAVQQRAMCLWLLRLSHTAKPLHRLVAVDMACSLLTSLPDPFGTHAGYKAFVDGSHGPGDDIAAPWSAVLLTLLAQRCDDKAAAVRARAVGHLADVLAHNARLLHQEPMDDMVDRAHQARLIPAQAEGYLLALCGTTHLQLSEQEVVVPAAPTPGAVPAAAVLPKAKSHKAKNARKAAKGKQNRRRGGAAESEEEDVDSEQEDDMAQGPTGPAAGEPAAAAAEHTVLQLEASLPSRIQLDLSPLMRLAHRRLQDDKAPVRKGALSLLEAGLLLRAGLPEPVRGTPEPEDILAIEAATADPLVSVRKAALAAASRLVGEFPHDPGCCELWVRAALPLIRDAETSLQEALLDQVQELVMKPLAAAASPSEALASRAIERMTPLLAAVAAAGRGAAACLGRACTSLAGKKQLQSKKVASGLEAVIRTLQAPATSAVDVSAAARTNRQQLLGAWGVLREISSIDPGATNWQFLQSSWATLQAAGKAASSGGEQDAALLWVLSNSAARCPAEAAQQLSEDLLQALLAFNLPPAAASAHISALHRLAGEAASKQGSGKQPAAWSSQLMEGAHQVLVKTMDRRQQRDEACTWRTCAALFVVGEVALLGVKAPAGLLVKVQALTHPSLSSNTVAGSQQPPAALLGSQQAGGTQQPMNVWQVVVVNGMDSQALPGGGPSQWQGATQLQENSTANGLASSLCGMAWLCLGKLCLTDESLAKKVAPLFVQELSRSSSPVVRNNCLVALADMCIHFTALVDSYLPRMASLIRDPHELVRRQALALLANLLMKDYVKWRGALFHRFALALVDSSAAVKQLAEYLLGDTLATKAPLLVYNHFIECMFVLNGCQAGLHASRLGGGGNNAAGDAMEGGTQADALAAARDACGQFNLRGSSQEMRDKRNVVYTTLLRKMSAENKFSTSAKLATEVLACVADGLLPLADEGVEEVLGDALRLLGSKHLKVVNSRMAASEEDTMLAAMEGQGATQMVAEVVKAKGKLVSGMMKKHLIEHMVPLLCELKHMLQEARNPMLGTLMSCMAALLKEHKNELEDILLIDKQLAKELLYDLKQAELAAKQQAQAQAAQVKAQAAAAAATGAAAHTLTPRPPTTAGRPAGSLTGSAGRGMATPGAAIRTASTASAAAAAGRTPGTAAAAAMLLNARTPGGRTPAPLSRGGSAAAAAAAAGMPTPAPVSTAKAAAARAAHAADGDDDDDTAPVGTGYVSLPPISDAHAPDQQWNVQLEEQPAAAATAVARPDNGRKVRRGARPAGTAAAKPAASRRGASSQVVEASAAAIVAAMAATENASDVTNAGTSGPGPADKKVDKGAGKAGQGSRKGRKALQQVNV